MAHRVEITTPHVVGTDRHPVGPDGVIARLKRVAAIVRRMIGVPDYDTYLAHMRERYPECTPLDLRSFERERLTARYKATGSRCC